MSRFSYNSILLLALLVLPMSGCMTTMVKEQKPRKGPVVEVGYIDLGGGEIKYSPVGYKWAIKMRRSSAMRRMRKLCAPLDFKITDEFTWEDVAVSYSEGKLGDQVGLGHKHYNLDPYIHIVFECLNEKKK